ncbi:DUF6494 family protein [Roseibium porphyridii]|uniref:DUF6494 family protein n=1 Tax=Roseibium porphyridii TaxID=2866279 RepID=A0ABY8F635_9HYPH|nr:MULTISPECIES: DUF6494 family protein [Stappiaceae]QFT30307.1 hypothetical protein FIV00_07475 [Labrenzia sp. THAF82]WFE90955.1 DUF6494 family protein [Roseibium sp. KMA01]
MSDDFNMSMRKFLKQVGVTSQQAIEKAVREADSSDGKTFKVKAVVTIEELGMEHVVTGEIEG